MITQNAIPIMNKICKYLPSSRYSQPNCPNIHQLLFSMPSEEAHSPSILPATTTINAQNKRSTRRPCRLGSCPSTRGTMYIPVANHVVATQNMTSCKCQGLAKLNGQIFCKGIPKNSLSTK